MCTIFVLRPSNLNKLIKYYLNDRGNNNKLYNITIITSAKKIGLAKIGRKKIVLVRKHNTCVK